MAVTTKDGIATVEFTVVRNGEDVPVAVTLPAELSNWPIKAVLAFEEGRVLSAVMGLLDSKSRARVLELDLTAEEFNDNISAALGEITEGKVS